MNESFEKSFQNKNFLMFTAAISYILGLYAYFTGEPLLFAGILTIISALLLIKNAPHKIIILWVLLFYSAFFNADLRIKNYDELSKLAPANCIISGQILSVPNSNISDNSKFFLRCEKISLPNGKSIPLTDKVLVNLNTNPNMSKNKNDDLNFLLPGNFCIISGKLRKPFHAANPSQFAYNNYLKNFKTFTVLYADKNNIKPVSHKLSPKWKIIRYLNYKRNCIISTHAKYLNSPNKEILGGIVFGDDAIAPPDYIKTTFINSGLLHILAASGMNVAFVSGFFLFFLKQLNVPYNTGIVLAIFVIILYSLMTGLGASVIRAALMLILILLGKLMDRDANSIALLSFVGLIMLVYNPAYINDVGFQLSFIVTFGILTCTQPIAQCTGKLPAWLAGSILIPVIAQLWAAPVQMFYFNTVSTYSVFANIISIPFLSIISFGGFISSLISLLTPAADFVCRLFDLLLNPLINILLTISTFFAKLPHALLVTTHPSGLQITLYYTALTLLSVTPESFNKNNSIDTAGVGVGVNVEVNNSEEGKGVNVEDGGNIGGDIGVDGINVGKGAGAGVNNSEEVEVNAGVNVGENVEDGGNIDGDGGNNNGDKVNIGGNIETASLKVNAFISDKTVSSNCKMNIVTESNNIAADKTKQKCLSSETYTALNITVNKNSKRKKNIISVCMLILILSAVIHIPNRNFEVIAFDVGNADAFLLKTPKNKYFIIDSGKSGYNAKKTQADIIILKYLKDKGIKNLEGFIITHFDDDHAGGATDIIRNLKIKNVYLNSTDDTKPIAKKIYNMLDKTKNINKIKVQNNSVIYTEDDKFTIKTFQADILPSKLEGAENENSIITLVQKGKMSILFNGDSGYKAFEKIKKDLPKNITVLKVGHHGAKTALDKEMIKYLNPKVSLISVGYNKYGHPHPFVLKLLSDTQIARTDKLNSVKITFKNNKYEVFGFNSKTKKYCLKFSGN